MNTTPAKRVGLSIDRSVADMTPIRLKDDRKQAAKIKKWRKGRIGSRVEWTGEIPSSRS